MVRVADSCCAGSLSYIALASSSTGVSWSGRVGEREAGKWCMRRGRGEGEELQQQMELLHPSTQTSHQLMLRQLREKKESEKEV